MKKSDLKILIIDDDARFLKALSEVVAKVGYQVTTSTNPTEAQGLLSANIYSALMIDCLLPKISGIDLVSQLKKQGVLSGQIIMMSGIFKDKNFIKDAMAKTGAVHFLAKPFNNDEAIKILNDLLEPLISDTRPPLEELFTKPHTSPGEKFAALAKTPDIHGYELPRLITLLMSAAPASNGILFLKDHDNKESKIHLSDGRIVRVESLDRQSYFGFLLVEKDVLKHAELEQVLQMPNPQNKRIGERLIDANILSPHWIPIVNAEQMLIRLSLLVQDVRYEVSFLELDSPEISGTFDRPILHAFLFECADAKVPIDWIRHSLLPWHEYTCRPTPDFLENHPVLTHHSFSKLPKLVETLKGGVLFSALFTQFDAQGNDLIQALYLLLTHGLIYFESKAEKIDHSVYLNRLLQLQNDFLNKDDFEVLGVPRKCRPNDIKKAYHELSKLYHPDKLGPGADKQLVELTKVVFGRMTTAYNRLSDDEQRTQYLKELEMGRAEKVFEAERILEEGKSFMKSGNPVRAMERFKFAATLRPMNSELRMNIVWAELANIPQAGREEYLKKVELELGKIPPEDRHNAFYYFVKALLFKAQGDLNGAIANLEHAVSIRPEFTEAKRELNLLQIQAQNAKKSSSLLNADLKDVVGMLFRKK